MRFLSDDGKVFNTKEECDEYEAALKEKSRLKEEEAELKKRNEELKKIVDKQATLLKQVQALKDEIDGYSKKYGSKLKNKDKSSSSKSEDELAEAFADLLMNYFN